MRPILFVCFALLNIAMAQEKAKTFVTEIKNAQGQVVGKGVFTPAEPRGVKLDLSITNLPPGSHAFHIHQKPICDASEEFNTAGLQYDPTGEMYGNADHKAHGGHSAGDPLSVISIDTNGIGNKSVVFPALTMGTDDHSIFANGGTAIMFHAAAGADGPTRIACGVIKPK